MLAHAVHSALYQSVFDRWFQGDLEPFVAGEQGVFSLAAYSLLTFWVFRQSPGEAAASPSPDGSAGISQVQAAGQLDSP